MDNLRILERQDKENPLVELQLLNEQARLPGREGWLANRRRQFLLTGEAPRIEPQPWFDEAIEEQYDYWLKVGLSCEPSNRQAAEQVISGFYRRLGSEPPQFVWCASPMAANQAMLEAENLGNQLDTRLYNQLWTQLWTQLWNQLRTQLRTQLWYRLRNQLWYRLRNQLYNKLRDQLRDQLGERSIYTNLWGSLDAFWIGHYMAGRELGVCYEKNDLEHLREWGALAHSCFWWWPYEDMCFVSDRPQEIQFRKDSRLKKCIFRDEWGIDR